LLLFGITDLEASLFLQNKTAMSFKDMSTAVASNWRAIDPDTKAYVCAVALLLKRRYKDLLKMSGPGCLSVTAAVPSAVTGCTQNGIRENQICNHTDEKQPHEEIIPRRLHLVETLSSTAAAEAPFPFCTFLKAEPRDIVSSDSVVLEQIAAVGPSNSLVCGNGNGRMYQEVDVSDSDILQFYHSIDI